MIKSVEQLLKRIKYIVQYIMLYILLLVIFNIIFIYIYARLGVSEPWRLSWDVFLSVQDSIPENVRIVAYIERIVYDLFSVVLVGTVLVRFLMPLNPIIFSKYITYDTVDKYYALRYWIMLPRRQYLYDVKVRVMVTDYESHQEGINKLPVMWEMDEAELEYDQIRGIRYVVLSEEESKELSAVLKKIEEGHGINGKQSDRKWNIDFVIRGTSENGTTYYGWHQYKHKNLLRGYRHVPMQQHEYDSEDFYRIKYMSEEERRNRKIGQDYYEKNKREFFRYQHFDKLFALPKCEKQTDSAIRRDILTQSQIRSKPFGGVRQIVPDSISLITRFWLDTDRTFTEVFCALLKTLRSKIEDMSKMILKKLRN